MNVRAREFRVESSPKERVESDMLATLAPLGVGGRLWILGLSGVCGLAVFAYVQQLLLGLRVTGMHDFVSWGVYMTNFVFFIGISHAGTLISAILRVTDAGWRRPITRMAEAITVFALMIGAPMVIIDMGRPDRVLNVFAYGRLQSPILWDVVSISTYLTGSILYLYVAMIPDMAILCRWAWETRQPRWRIRLYRALSLGYRGTPEQERRLNLALGAMAVIIIPVAISVHTVVSWIFGMTLRPGWHSTVFGPYFVIGAIYSGTAGILTAMAIFRRGYHLERYLRPEHFRRLGKLLLVLTLLYTYFTLSEYLTAWYGGLDSEARLLDRLMGLTPYGLAFWLWVGLGLFAPLALLLMPSRRSIAAIVSASVLINIGMWAKRYLIVVPTLQTPFLPAEAAGVTPGYSPTWVEWAITAGAVAAFLLLYTLFSRLFPILSIWETAEDEAERAAAPAPPPPVNRWGVFGTPLLLLPVALSALAAWPARAQTPAPPRPQVQVEVGREVEGEDAVLLATVRLDGRPLAGATVAFSVRRSFGDMTLGEDVTLEDGTAAVPFPSGLPGGPRGELQVRAELLAPAAVAGARGTAVVAGGAARSLGAAPMPRALWASRAPLALVGSLAFLLLVVWSIYAVVLRQLVHIHTLGKEP